VAWGSCDRNRLFVVWILPFIFHPFLAAQQVSTFHKTVAHKQPALPPATSTTAYDPYFYEGRGYWERNFLVYVPSRDDVRVDLYDKDTLRSSLKVSIPNTNRVHVFDATVTEDGRLIVAGCYVSETGQRHCFVGLADLDGHVSPIVDTGKFSPTKVSACDGATVWAIGWLRTGPDLDRESNEPYRIRREYRLADAKMVNSALERTTFCILASARFLGVTAFLTSPCAVPGKSLVCTKVRATSGLSTTLVQTS